MLSVHLTRAAAWARAVALLHPVCSQCLLPLLCLTLPLHTSNPVNKSPLPRHSYCLLRVLEIPPLRLLDSSRVTFSLSTAVLDFAFVGTSIPAILKANGIVRPVLWEREYSKYRMPQKSSLIRHATRLMTIWGWRFHPSRFPGPWPPWMLAPLASAAPEQPHALGNTDLHVASYSNDKLGVDSGKTQRHFRKLQTYLLVPGGTVNRVSSVRCHTKRSMRSSCLKMFCVQYSIRITHQVRTTTISCGRASVVAFTTWEE